jgi:hypothetical protein
MPNCSLLQDAVLSYVVIVDELYGHYLDTTCGFVANERLITENQAKARPSLAPGTDMDQLTFFYGHGDPNDPSNRILHQTTQGAYKARNAEGGRNHVRAAQLLLVLVFEYWESEHRTHIANALGLADWSELKVPVLGDLRELRQDVIHHRGIVRGETVKKLGILKGFIACEQIQLTGEQVETIIVEVKSALDSLVVQAGCPDPLHRKVWRVQ